MIGLIALLVIGPERLPKVARLAGFWLGKTRHMIASVKAEINEELRAEEMRQIFKEQSGMTEVQQIIDETSDTLKSTLAPLPAASRAQHDLNADPEQHEEPLPTDNAGQHEFK